MVTSLKNYTDHRETWSGGVEASVITGKVVTVESLYCRHLGDHVLYREVSSFQG